MILNNLIRSRPGGKWPGQRWWLAVLLTTCAGLWFAPAALAQQTGGTNDAGRIERRIERPAEKRGTLREIAPAVPAPKTETGEERFTLIGAEITGSTFYSGARLGDFYEEYLGREISLAEVDKIVKAITEQYRKDGYVLSRAIVPPQPLAFGVLRIRIVEGYVEKVTFTGDKPGREALLDAMAEKIKAERPLTLATLERYLLLMAYAPGVTVEPGLREIVPDQPAYEMSLKLNHDRFDGFANFDNHGTTVIGPHAVYLAGNFNSIFGGQERTRLAVFTVPTTPEELRYGEINHEQRLNAEGTRAYFTLSRSLVDIGEVANSNKDNSRSTRLVIGAAHPIVRRRDINLTARLDFDALNSEQSGVSGDYADRLRVFRLALEFNARDGWNGTNWITLQYSRGFDILHATDRGAGLTSRTNGRASFRKVTLDVTRLQKLTDTLSVQLQAAGQTSPQTLLSSEEFGVGGSRFGRAYDSSDITGSQGAAGSVELQFRPP